VPPLILASTSLYRRDLLGRLGLPFEALAPGVHEDRASATESHADRALRLALKKADAISQRHPAAIVIGSDQVATDGEQLLEKPGDAARCRSMLASLSGRTARFYTACAVRGAEAGVRLAHIDTTTVTFRFLSDVEIARYVARDRPEDCAGGFKAESLGVSLLESIESHDPTALIGLPLIWLAGALRALGYAVP